MRRALAATVALPLAVLTLFVGSAGAAAAIVGGGRVVTLLNEVSIESVAGDAAFPFDRPEPGELVFFRVRVTSDGPSVARKGELWVAADVASDDEPEIAGRQGVRCRTTRGVRTWIVLCGSTRVVREGDSLSVLIKVRAAGKRVVVSAAGGKARGVESDLVVRSRKDSASIAVAIAEPVAGPWTGVWTWKATWPGGSFVGRGMSIRQDGTTACARWPWSSGGTAKGSVAADGVWAADWNDTFGAGSWVLALDPGAKRFTGTQIVDPHAAGANDFVATIVGERTGAATAVSLDCDGIQVGRPAVGPG